jgi:hypothetical protein
MRINRDIVQRYSRVDDRAGISSSICHFISDSRSKSGLRCCFNRVLSGDAELQLVTFHLPERPPGSPARPDAPKKRDGRRLAICTNSWKATVSLDVFGVMTMRR